MGENTVTFEANRRIAKHAWRGISRSLLYSLRDITIRHHLSIAAGDLLLLDGRWYVTHTGLLGLAVRNRCAGIDAKLVTEFCDPKSRLWTFCATVYKTKTCRGFAGFGDADPSNVSPLVQGAEMRVAETRAVNRALRKAYGIGLCSAEEIGASPPISEKLPPQNTNGFSAGPKVRDRLCQIIRQNQLDPELVKAYAVDFCGAKTLREATREQLENFVQELAEWAVKDRNALLCQLNSYMRPAKEVVA
jgi:hypothetical protein